MMARNSARSVETRAIYISREPIGAGGGDVDGGVHGARAPYVPSPKSLITCEVPTQLGKQISS